MSGGGDESNEMDRAASVVQLHAAAAAAAAMAEPVQDAAAAACRHSRAVARDRRDPSSMHGLSATSPAPLQLPLPRADTALLRGSCLTVPRCHGCAVFLTVLVRHVLCESLQLVTVLLCGVCWCGGLCAVLFGADSPADFRRRRFRVLKARSRSQQADKQHMDKQDNATAHNSTAARRVRTRFIFATPWPVRSEGCAFCRFRHAIHAILYANVV